MSLEELKTMLSNEDKKQIAAKGISEAEVEEQLDRFMKGFPALQLSEPAVVDKGISLLTDDQVADYISTYENASANVSKFVPASGAASRMFKLLYKLLEDFDETQPDLNSMDGGEKLEHFFESLDQFAFYDELKSKYFETNGKQLEDEISDKNYDRIIDFLLNTKGLNYGNLPKGLLSFHTYDHDIRTAAQEQLDEGLKYACKNDRVIIHFTVSPDHLDRFQDHVSAAIEGISSETEIEVSYSLQKEKTDTIASTPDFQPFKTNEGDILFRPAGHGALLENLNDLDYDLVFIKNIDNVVPDRLKETTIKYKKALAGVLLEYQQKTFDLLKRNDQNEHIHDEAVTLLKEMGIEGDFSKEEILDLLDRPIRVCGMVKNEGEPGGGPFWIRSGNRTSLQIVESAQVNADDQEQIELFKSGTHFNPVDLVCGLKNYKGEKFNLLEHRDVNTGFISEKSYNGETLLAMELPGLWNGSMSDWNTIFVEVPLITFNPVKTVLDLLKPNHR